MKRQERIRANGENKDEETDKFRLKMRINRYTGRGVTEAGGWVDADRRDEGQGK